MPPIDPRLVRAKRYPVHAAVCCCYPPEMERLLIEDAPFHIVRKVPDLEIGVLHSACASRPGFPAPDIFYRITKYLLKMGAPINEKDSVGQTALHYAVCHHYAVQLSKILIESGADLSPRRDGDGWTPLHLAAMFGKCDVTQVLLEAGASPSIVGSDGKTPEDVAKQYRHHALADILCSPRINFEPKTFPNEYEDLLKPADPDQGLSGQTVKITDALVNWRDEEGNTLLHLAAWKGRIHLSRAFFDSVKGRKLVTVQNKKGALPLAMAIINGQDKMTEEFFMNKFSKKLIDFGITLNDTKENIVHLLLKYAPNVHPKFILKRKDLTKEHLNALDSSGESVFLYLAKRNSSPTLRKILESKNVSENKLLDLSFKTKEGKTALHYLVEHRDEQNCGSLLDREELTVDVANVADSKGRSPLVTCLLEGSAYMARDILEHPTAKDKFKLDLCHTSDGRSPLHLVAEQGNGQLWQLAVSRPDCDMNARDAGGNTPLMSAAICGRTKMLETFLRDLERAKQVDLSMVNSEGKTLLILLIEHIQEIRLLKLFLKTVDAKESINLIDKSCHTALSAAIHLNKWNVVKELLTNVGLKTGDPLQEDTLEGTIDVHPVNDEGQSALAMMVLARIKLSRQEQTYLMKKQRSLAVEAKKEQELLWELIKLMLVREKEQHGTSMVQGRDGGSDCIKSQLSVSKLIRQPNVDEIVLEFTKQYQFVKRKRPPPGPTAPALQGPLPTTTPPPVPSNDSLASGPPPTTAPPPVPESDDSGSEAGPVKQVHLEIDSEKVKKEENEVVKLDRDQERKEVKSSPIIQKEERTQEAKEPDVSSREEERVEVAINSVLKESNNVETEKKENEREKEKTEEPNKGKTLQNKEIKESAKHTQETNNEQVQEREVEKIETNNFTAEDKRENSSNPVDQPAPIYSFSQDSKPEDNPAKLDCPSIPDNLKNQLKPEPVNEIPVPIRRKRNQIKTEETPAQEKEIIIDEWLPEICIPEPDEADNGIPIENEPSLEEIRAKWKLKIGTKTENEIETVTDLPRKTNGVKACDEIKDVQVSAQTRPGFVDVGVQTDIPSLSSECTCHCHHK